MKKLIITIICLLFAATSYSQTWELAIAKRDEDGTRKKLGDVIAYRPYPWVWGGMELKHYLIVVVDGITEEECSRLIFPLYEFPDGKVIEDDGWIDFGAMLGKRRYNINTTRLKTRIGDGIQWAKCFDPASTYQPFDHGEAIIDFKSDKGIYDKHNEEHVYFGTAPVIERTE